MNAQEIADARRDANAAVDSSTRAIAVLGTKHDQYVLSHLALYLLQALTALESAREDLKKYENMVSEKWLEARK
jgi:hypothetical protein